MKNSYQQIIIAILVLYLFMRLCNRQAETYTFSVASDAWDVVQDTGDSARSAVDLRRRVGNVGDAVWYGGVKRGAGLTRDGYGGVMDLGGNTLDFVGSGVGGVRAGGSSLLDKVPGIKYVKPVRDIYGGAFDLAGTGFRTGRSAMGSGRALGGRGLDVLSSGADTGYETVKNVYGGAVRAGDKGVRIYSGAVDAGAGLYDRGITAGINTGLKAGRKIKGFFN